MKIYKSKYLVLFLYLVTSSFLYSQHSLKGKVVNIENEPLPYSTIHLMNDNHSVVKSLISNEKGYFEIPMDSIYIKKLKFIFARFLNTTSDTINITHMNKIKLLIKNAGNMILNEVVINSKKPSLISKSDRFIYTPNESIKNGSSALDVLKVAPLLDFDLKSETLTIINKSNTVVTINGRKSKLPKEVIASILRTTPAKNIKNIEIITNPGSEYSSNSTGGIININLNRNLDDGFLGYINVSSEQSKFNTSILNGSLHFRKDKLGVRISPFINKSFNYYTTENFTINFLDNIENTNSKFERKYLVLGGGFGLDYDIDNRNLLSLNGFISKVNGNSKQKNRTEYSSNNMSEIDSIYSSPVKGNDFYLYNFGNVFYQHKLDTLNNKKITVNFDYNQFKKDEDNIGNFIREFPNMQKNTYKNIFPQNFLNLSSSIDYSTKINDKTKLNLGIQFSSSKFDNKLSYFTNSQSDTFVLDETLTSKYNYEETYLASYLSYNKTFSNKINASFGVRIEKTNYLSENNTTSQKIDSSYLKLFPNISIAYTIKNKKVLSLSLSKKIKRPSIESLFPGRTYINPNYFEENNPFLQPVTYYNADVMYALNYKYYFSSGFSYRNNQFEQFIIPVNEDGETLQKKTILNYGDSTKSYIQFYTKQNLLKDLWIVHFSSSLNFLSFSKNIDYLKNETITNTNYNFSINNIFNVSKKKNTLVFAIIKYYSPIENIVFKRDHGLFKTDVGIKRTYKNLSASLYFNDIFNTYSVTKIKYHGNQIQKVNLFNKNEYNQSLSLSISYSIGNSKLNKIKNKKIANDKLKNRL